MPKFIIQGNKPLSGQIAVAGAKNEALKIIPSALLSEEPLLISNLPDIEDTKRALEIIEDLGGSVNHHDEKTIIISISNISKNILEAKFANKIRASIMFIAPLLARQGEAIFPHPGGCVLGADQRPIDLFLEGYKKLGAEISIKDGLYHLKAKRLKGCRYFFTKISVTGTESLLMAATLAEGTTILENCAMEPEIVSLAKSLNQRGAIIKGAGTPTIVIEGVKKINGGEVKIMPDRIETGTFAILSAATRSPLKITNCEPNHIAALLTIFEKIGIDWEANKDSLTIKKIPKDFPSYSIKTHEYPGFPSDLQSPYTVLMTQANGSAMIHETIYDRRLLFTDMLSQMGAKVTMCDPHRVLIQGPTKLHGRALTSPDLRAGISMIIAGLIAEGKTEIDNIYQIERGYEKIDERLRAIGAEITKIE